MRIFHNPKDRKGLEDNEQKAFKIEVKQNKNEYVEPESTGSGSSETKNKEENETSKKAGKKKAD